MAPAGATWKIHIVSLDLVPLSYRLISLGHILIDYVVDTVITIVHGDRDDHRRGRSDGVRQGA